MKVWFSAKELAGVAGLSKYPTNVTRLAKKEKWTSRPLVGVKGGGVEYALSSFPQEVQEEIRDKFATSVVVAKPKKLPVMRSVALTELTEKQRQAAEARMALVAYVLKLEEVQPRYKAVKFFCQQAKQHLLSPELMQLVAKANNKKGESRVIGERTLNQWVLDYEKATTPEERLKALVPMQRVAKKAEEISWLPDFLAEYRQTNGINVAEAYGYFAQHWRERFADQPLMLEMLPSLDRVRRVLAKLPRHIKEIGRKMICTPKVGLNNQLIKVQIFYD
ncbi:Putative Transposase-like Mu [Avibacterium paragallinarum JF4211]|uniref:Transposase n=1 Tax=Avibacterium paragallinarum TaxID=728 RepID=A0A377IWJ0_AVIPA|nr:Putative Transposase-like Mu [Avibacterium paragallinarum JF4211]STO91990.1 transposase [Avibacterium paragallinarum]